MDRSLGKGRQSLIPLLADWGDGEFGETLGLLVADSEVRGHAIKALTKARIGGHREQVQKVAEETSGWIRQAAKKYLSKVNPV